MAGKGRTKCTLGEVTQTTCNEDFECVLKEAGDKLVVVDFFACWCGPCRMIGPKVKQMAKEFPDVIFIKVDVDEDSDTAEKHEISAMPTILFFKNGVKVADVVGASEVKIREAILKNK